MAPNVFTRGGALAAAAERYEAFAGGAMRTDAFDFFPAYMHPTAPGLCTGPGGRCAPDCYPGCDEVGGG